MKRLSSVIFLLFTILVLGTLIITPSRMLQAQSTQSGAMFSPKLQDDDAAPEGDEIVATVVTAANRVNLRATPSITETPLRFALWGEKFLVREDVEPVDDGRYVWLPIVVDGEEGWIASSLVLETIEFKGDPLSVACPLGQGFWKNHPAVWSIDTMTIGAHTYTQEELLALFNTPVQGDASLNLAHQLIAAWLNVENGVDAKLVTEALAEANTLLAEFEGTLPYKIAPSSETGQTMVAIAGELDNFNTRAPLPDCDPDVVNVTIEGPVTEIEANVITIYDIEIELDPDDLILTVIQIGDVISLTGDLATVDGVFVVVVVINVAFISVEVYFNDDFTLIWRDIGGCYNAPPPWAPAHGWRARCGGNWGGSGSGSHSGSHSGSRS